MYKSQKMFLGPLFFSHEIFCLAGNCSYEIPFLTIIFSYPYKTAVEIWQSDWDLQFVLKGMNIHSPKLTQSQTGTKSWQVMSNFFIFMNIHKQEKKPLPTKQELNLGKYWVTPPFFHLDETSLFDNTRSITWFSPLLFSKKKISLNRLGEP